MDSRSIRKFICKRCGKPSKDLQGGFNQFSTKHNIVIQYENIDLCDRCFKITNREQKHIENLKKAIELGVISDKDIESLKLFQSNVHFRKTILEKIGVIKVNGIIPKTSKYPPSYYRRLLIRKNKREIKEQNENK